MVYYPATTAKLMIGTDLVGQCTGYNLTESTEVEEVTPINSLSKVKAAGLNDWNGSADFYYDLSDAGQLAAMNSVKNGTSCTVKFYFDGTHYRSGDAIVKQASTKISAKGHATLSVSFEGTGALSDMQTS